MDKTRIASLPLFILLHIISGSLSAQTNQHKDSNRLELVFITTCVEEDFFKPVMKGMTDAASQMEVKCVFTGTKGVNVEEQVKMVEDAIKNGADGIALNIIDSVAFDEVVKKAILKGIPVVAFNGDDTQTDNDRLSAVVQDHLKGGRLFGEKVISHIPANSMVLATMHSEGISALDDRLSGMKEVLKEKNITFKIAITTNNSDSASKVIKEMLRANPEIVAVLSTGLADTEGTGMAIASEFSDRNLVAAGFDLSREIIGFIKDGQLIFTVDQQPYMQGYYPVVQLTQYLRYGIIPCDNEIGASFVTSENVAEVEKLINEGYR